MAKLKGAGIKPAKKVVAKRRMEKMKGVFALATTGICILLLVTVLVGLAGRGRVIEQYGGAETMAGLTQAELQFPYFKYVNELIGALPGPSFIWTIIWFVPMMILTKTCQWHLGIIATAWFSFGVFLELALVLVCGILYFKWKKIATAKPERKKPNVDIMEKMNREAQEEAKKLEQETKAAQQRAKDEDWEKRRQEIMLEKTQQRIKSRTNGRRRAR